MGNPDDIMAKLIGYKFFTKIHLSKGYWQIQMDEDSKELTGFGMHNGCYQFKKMPFGLVSSVTTFSRMMRKMFHQVKKIEHSVDDFLVHTTVRTEHLESLRELFIRIRKAGLTVHQSKCCLVYSSLEFVSHTVNSNRIAME